MSVLENHPQWKPGPRHSVYLLSYFGAILLAFSLWHARVNQALPLRAIAALALIVALSLAYGRFFLRRVPHLLPEGRSLALDFLAGYLILNTLLFVLEVASPLGMSLNLLVAATGGVVLWSYRPARPGAAPEHAALAPDLIALVVSAAGATLWCSDGLTPWVQDGADTIFRLWGDSFVHARQISALMHAHGWASLSDFRMSGATPYLYHYASYATPAAVAAIAEAGAYETFASFQLPVGIFLTGLAAFALAAALWGRWAGVAASIAVVLIPDAYQQGFGNKYLSYDFMQQVNVAGLYGVASMALAWVFVLRGCQTSRWPWIFVGWAIAAVTLAYKAHIFVANAFLIMIYPSLFFAGLKPRWRLATAVGLGSCYLVVVTLAQHIDRVPTLRLDGSGAQTYLANLLANYDPGPVQGFFAAALGAPPWPPFATFVYGAGMIALSTFGGWSLAAVAAVAGVRRRVGREVWLFPLLVMTNYLVMALGLAMDRNEVGAPDELLNRPLVWAYFAIATWTAGALYFLLLGRHAPKTLAGRLLASSMAILCLAGPLAFAQNLQTYPRWAGFGSFKEAGSVPTCLVATARYIRSHSAPTDLVQDSEDDASFVSKLVVTALSERQGFALSTSNGQPAGIEERLRELAAFKRMDDVAEIRRFAESRKIAWYVMRPTTPTSWPPIVVDAPAFACGGYRLYRFGQ